MCGGRRLVTDSPPEAEFQEAVNQSKAMLKAVAVALAENFGVGGCAARHRTGSLREFCQERSRRRTWIGVDFRRRFAGTFG